MNTINNNFLVHAAMDGQSLYNNSNIKNTNSSTDLSKTIAHTGAEVAQNIEQSLQEIETDTKELEKMSEMVSGHKLQFNVNKELGSVVVKILDSNTNQVIKEIPSEDIQNLKMRLKKAMGAIFDELI